MASSGAYSWGQGPDVGPNPYDREATTILVLGILGLVSCGILGIVAFVMGRNLKERAEAAGYPEPANCRAGRICGTIIVVLLAFVIFVAGIASIFLIAARYT